MKWGFPVPKLSVMVCTTDAGMGWEGLDVVTCYLPPTCVEILLKSTNVQTKRIKLIIKNCIF